MSIYVTLNISRPVSEEIELEFITYLIWKDPPTTIFLDGIFMAFFFVILVSNYTFEPENLYILAHTRITNFVEAIQIIFQLGFSKLNTRTKIEF